MLVLSLKQSKNGRKCSDVQSLEQLESTFILGQFWRFYVDYELEFGIDMTLGMVTLPTVPCRKIGGDVGDDCPIQEAGLQ